MGFQRLWELDAHQLAKVVTSGIHIQTGWSSQAPKLSDECDMIPRMGEEISWLSPITSKYMLCCTKTGNVMCWDVHKRERVVSWKAGDNWEIWKCRVEFDERIVYFAMAKRPDNEAYV